MCLPLTYKYGNMGKRTTQLGEITTVDNNDILYGVDVSDLTHSPDGTSVKFKKDNLLKEVNSRAGDIEDDVSELQGVIAGLLDWFYPIGTIYETTSNDLDTTTKMDNHFGGTWEEYGSSRVLVGKSTDTEFDTIGKTGGATTHTLTVAQMPTHTHVQNAHLHGTKGGTGSGGSSYRVHDYASTTNSATGGDNFVPTLETTATNQNAGSSQAHNNLQPYVVVYRYRRIA